MVHKKRKKKYNDLLLPVIITLALLPFMTRAVLYSCGLSSYPWFSDDDTVSDFFTYYKSVLFLVIAIAAFIILFLYFLLYRNRIKSLGRWIPLGAYFLFSLVSAVLSVNKQASLFGAYGHFETIFVLFGYGIIALYTYQFINSEEDLKSVTKALALSLAVLCLVGFFQMAGKDLLHFEFIQKIILPVDYWPDYLGRIKNQLSSNAVSLTLFNPNYASVYLAMMISFFAVLLISSDSRKSKLLHAALTGSLLVLLFKTYSRTGLVSLFVVFLLLGYFYRHKIKAIWKQCVLALLFSIALFLAVDSQSGFRFTAKLGATAASLNTHKINSLEKIETKKDSVLLLYKGEDLYLSLSPSTEKGGIQFTDSTGRDITDLYREKTGILDWKSFQDIRFSLETNSGKLCLTAKINDITWRFFHDSKEGYLYLNDFKKADKISAVPFFGFAGHENLASGRGYIWSRSLPLLAKYMLGSGPDTFLYVFPQGDYVGKANNCKTPVTLIEKPHNLYLMTGIQTGILSLAAFLCYYILYLLQSFRLYKACTFRTYTEQVGLACLAATVSYMVSGFFNDSSLQTSPCFWVLTGMGMSVNLLLEKQRKSRSLS